jgi:S1-C subfamily serine protease
MTAGMGLAEQAGVEIASLVERVRLSMVRAETSGVGGGSGTIWDASGLIVTNRCLCRSGTNVFGPEK